MKDIQNRISNIANLLQSADKNLKKAQQLLSALTDEVKTSYDDVPGVLGVFDGSHMVDSEGKKYEVNPNYAAKSLLVAGDNLKMVEGEDGKQLFKQVSKVDRKTLQGVLNKKEGKWYALTDAGSYRILDVAIEFREGEVNDDVVVLVPEGNLNVEWCALEKMPKRDELRSAARKEREKEEPKVEKVEEKVEVKEVEKPKEKPAEAPKTEKKPERKPERKPDRKPAPRRSAPSAPSRRKPAPAKSAPSKPSESSGEVVASLLDADDLR